MVLVIFLQTFILRMILEVFEDLNKLEPPKHILQEQVKGQTSMEISPEALKCLKCKTTFNVRYPFILIKIFYLQTFYQKSIYWAFLVDL